MCRPAILVGLALGMGMAFAAPALATADDTTPPSAPELIAPAADVFTNDSTPTLTWTTATDDVGVVGYALVFDDVYLGDVDAADCTSTCETTVAVPVSDGSHAWQIWAFDAADNETASERRALTVDTVAPWAPGSMYPAENTVYRDKRCIAPRVIQIGGHGDETTTVTVDGVSSPPGVTTVCNLAEGWHTFTLTVMDRAGNEATMSRHYRIDAVRPGVTVTVPPRAAVGEPITLNGAVAAGTFAPGPLAYTWLLGDDRQVGPGPALPATVTYTQPGTRKLTLSATDADADVGSGTAKILVGPKPPAGKPGVAIADGAAYVNRRMVNVAVVWPPGATTLHLLNAGEAKPKGRKLGETVRWALTGAGTTRKPTKITATFDWPIPAKTYTDSILLDLEKPKVKTAVLRGGKVRTTVIEKVSGVDTIQTAVRRSKPAKAKPYRTALRVATNAKFVRVTDRAGNVSAWKAVKHA